MNVLFILLVANAFNLLAKNMPQTNNIEQQVIEQNINQNVESDVQAETELSTEDDEYIEDEESTEEESEDEYTEDESNLETTETTNKLVLPPLETIVEPSPISNFEIIPEENIINGTN